jgi:hypothetical protein
MKKMVAAFVIGLLAGVILVLMVNYFTVQAEARGEASMSQYERDHLYKLDQQIRAINELVRQVDRIADNTRN